MFHRSLLACLLPAILHAQDRAISGRVLDAKGTPVAKATVSTFWRANGSAKRPDGTDFDLNHRSELVEYWSRLGQMAPLSLDDSQAVTDVRGPFKVVVHNVRPRTLIAMDASRNIGAIAELPDDATAERMIEIKLVPLATVKARIRSSQNSNAFQWTHAYVELTPDPKNPLAIHRLISCGSFDGRLEFRLPPGDYQLDAYASSNLQSEDIDLRVHTVPEFTVRETDSEIDLGVLELTAAPPDRNVLERESKDKGRWRDATEHYGEIAPEWHSVDGRGIDHRKNIGQLQGKWVLLDFWGLGCAPCLGRGIPKLMEFYEKNAKSKSKFEIVGVCIDYSGEIATVCELESRLAAIEARAWNGKTIPFPIVLDNSFKTWERYGIPGLGTIVLVDPEGRITEGDETTLQEILDKAEHIETARVFRSQARPDESKLNVVTERILCPSLPTKKESS